MELNINSTGRNRVNKNSSQSNNFTNFQYFLESSLKISEIENKGNEQTKKFDSINSYNFESINNNKPNEQKRKILNIKKKLTKEVLNNIPLPIFSCIYCSNEKVAFNHLINEKIYDKYFLQTSIYDMKNLDEIIKTNSFIDLYNKNPPLVAIIIKNTEFIRHYYGKNELNEYFSSKIFKNISEVNSIKMTKNFLQKLEDKYIRKLNKELLSNNKQNSNKLFNFEENKILFQKQDNNNSTFTNENLTTNKNTIANSIGTGLTQNIGISSFLYNNNDNMNIINNNINICFNPNNMMQSIMEKIEKNEESDGESEERFLDILVEKNNYTHKINKSKISFEEKFYDIWNPDITLINEEEENIKDKNHLSYRNIKHIKGIKYFIKKNKKQNKNKFNINNVKNINKEENIITNYNNENKINKKIIYQRNIFSPNINNNLKKRNLMNFINYKNGRNINIDILKHKYFTKDNNDFNNNNYNNKIDMINNLLTTKSKKNYKNAFSRQKLQQKLTQNLLHLLKSKTGINMYKNKNNNMNSNRLIRKATLSSKNDISHSTKKSSCTFSNFFDADSKETKHKSININNDLYQRKNNDINFDIDINKKKFDLLSKYLKANNNSLLCSSLKEKRDQTSLPNLKINLSPINNYKNKVDKIKMNPNKKIRIKNNLRKINSYNFLKNRYVSLLSPLIKKSIFSIK